MSAPTGKKQKILIVSSRKLGAGHFSVAKSLEAYLLTKSDVDVYLYDWNSLIDNSYEMVMSSMPQLMKLSYRFFDSNTVGDFAKGYGNNLMHKTVSKPLSYFDKIILTIHSAQYMGYSDALSNKTYVVVTDHGKVFKPWGTYSPRIFFVCDKQTEDSLRANPELKDSKFVHSSIPVNPNIKEIRELDRPQLRIELSITSKHFYTIVLGGAGDKRMSQLIENLLTENLEDRSFLIVCGRNKRMKEMIEELIPEEKRHIIRVVGFLPNDELIRYYRASDIVISKPGGITTTELVNLGTPIAMPFIYPVEAGNRDFIIENKAGLYHPDLETFFKVVFNLSTNQLTEYSENMRKIATLSSAEIICETIIHDRIS